MVVVAVAGGNGDVGKAIVEELVSVGKHTIIVLTRASTVSPERDGVQFLGLDYADIDGMAQALQNNNVHTIISAMPMEGPGGQSQLNIIEAAGKSSTTERFIPSEYMAYIPDGNPDEVDPMMAPLLRTRQAIVGLGLKTTRIAIGMFMDYFGHPNIPSTLRPSQWAIDVATRRATIPGTGDDLVTLTYSKDVAKFVARLVDDDDWPEHSIISGSDVSMNDIVALAEKATDEKFEVTYDSAEDLKAGKATLVAPNPITYNGFDPVMMAAMMGGMVIQGAMKLPRENRLNDRYPDVKPMSIEQMMMTAWSSK